MKILFIVTMGLISLTACATQNSGYGRHHRGMGYMGKNMPMMSVEMHKDMAKMHSEMAICLESKKSKEDCQKITSKYRAKMCPEYGKNKNCPYAEMMEENSEAESKDVE